MKIEVEVGNVSGKSDLRHLASDLYFQVSTRK
jgi:hypothetical protein